MLNEKIIASVCFSTSIGLNKLAATEDIFFIQIRAASATPSVALTCVLFSHQCFLPTTFYYSAFQRIEGNPKVLRDGTVKTEARTEHSGEANACARVLFINFLYFFATSSVCNC